MSFCFERLKFSSRRLVSSSIALLLALLLLTVAHHAYAQTAASAPSSTTGTKPASPTAASVSTTAASASVTTPAGATPLPASTLKQEQLVAPVLAATGLDVAARGKSIMDHLDAALRFYHSAIAPAQKVGEPSDVLYQEESTAQVTALTRYAFQAARNEAAVLDKIPAKGGQSQDTTPDQQNEVQRMATLREQTAQRVSDLQAQDAALSKQIDSAKPSQVAALRQQQQAVQGQLELQKAMNDALARVGNLSESQSQTGLTGAIVRLQNSAPELLNASAKPAPPPTLQSLSAAREGGVMSQAPVLFQLLSSRHAVEQQMQESAALRAQVVALREPIIQILRNTVQQGETLSQQAGTPSIVPNAPAPAAPSSDDTRKRYDALTDTFQVLSNAILPLSQETMLLDQERTTLSTWRDELDDEYKSILRSLLLRVVGIASALILILLLNQVWGRATVRYVHDLRRRRQLLVVRRIVMGFLTGIVLIFGVTTQFSSIATFAGFISAGIAVGLQTILLSVAAYFFIIGRYGVRVGDRITVAGVTGDVVEVGLARFYLTELAGSGTDMHPTGRVAVFANSVLFQTGTPLFKQMPGTEYAWHELTVKLNQAANFQAAATTVLRSVEDVYKTYKKRIDEQHQQVESWMGTALQQPEIQSRLQLAEGGLQFTVLFPVEIVNAAEADEKITESLINAMNTNEQVKTAIAAPPVIKAAIKV